MKVLSPWENLQVWNLSTLYFLLSTLYWPSANRDDRTAIELFIDGVRGWETGLRRRLDDGKSKPD